MRASYRGCFLVCLLALGVLAWAQQKPVSPVPGSGFAFTGDWNCSGTFRNNKAHRSTFTAAVILDGKWLELTEHDIEPATGYVAKYLIGYDPQAKRLVEFDANNFGAATYSSAEGWNHGVLTMTSSILEDTQAPYVANRFIYTVGNADSFIVNWQISKTAALEWIQADRLTCKRQPDPKPAQTR